MNLNLRIGIIIKRFRKQKDMTQLDLANEVGITQAYVSMIENGKANLRINLNSLAQIANAIGFKLSNLIAIAETVDDMAFEFKKGESQGEQST